MTTATAVKPQAPQQQELTGLDRCDRCGSRAYVRVLLVTGGELLFCNHHATQYETKLRPMAALWQDERHLLYMAEKR